MANTVTVWARNETMRKLLRHPSGVSFREDINEGVAWPADTFTARRIRDGDVTDQRPTGDPKSVEHDAVKRDARATHRRSESESSS